MSLWVNVQKQDECKTGGQPVLPEVQSTAHSTVQRLWVGIAAAAAAAMVADSDKLSDMQSFAMMTQCDYGSFFIMCI